MVKELEVDGQEKLGVNETVGDQFVNIKGMRVTEKGIVWVYCV